MGENRLRKFIEDYEARVAPLSAEANVAYFNASISGKEKDYAGASELELELSQVYSNTENFKILDELLKSGEIKDDLLKRQLVLMHNEYASHQIDPKLLKEIIDLSTKIEAQFATFRAEINRNKLTDNQIDEILESSVDSKLLEKAWKASKKIGNVVAKNVIKLVKLRNKGARQLGFDNYHQMSLTLSEQNPDEMEILFDELNNLTEEKFSQIKAQIDKRQSKKFDLPEEKLQPWHYEDKFFQTGTKITNVDFDKYFKEKDIVRITHDYYSGLGLEINDLIEKCDLFEKPGKYQHAYCTDIDREGDIRVVCNIKPNHRWMGTMLHEFGHAVYDKYCDKSLPWQLRTHSHIFTTEAIAMLFGRFASNPVWLKEVINVKEEEAELIKEEAYKALVVEQLAFSRWVQVMYRFEKEMYNNPDQDLNILWWKLVEKYQLLKQPDGRDEPDWASKIHVALYPAYYHNYMLGELLASQLLATISEKILNSNADEVSFAGQKEVGDFLIKNIFRPGAKLFWNDLIEKATGEKLTAKYYANQFVK